LKSISDLPIMPFGNGSFKEVISLVGHPVTALLIGVVAAFAIPKRLTRDMVSVNGWVGEAIFRAGSIILITAAGGAFGKVLQNSGIASIAGASLSKANLGIWLPAIIAAILKTVQGSSTVAIVTTASLLSPLMDSLGFSSPIAKALIVVAIGAGSMIASHANDSYFWVVTQSSKMDVKIGYKLHTLGTLLQGLASVITVWVMSLFFI
ncbi:MAG: GntP family permease, partial [Fervidobacterium sp.]|nr:GntP family permease [Fervidobacterium sp.]